MQNNIFWFVECFHRNLEFSPYPCIKNRKSFISFSATSQLVRRCKATKMFQGLFKKILSPILAKNFQNWPFWTQMPKSGGYLNFCRNPFIRICQSFVLSLVSVVLATAFLEIFSLLFGLSAFSQKET